MTSEPDRDGAGSGQIQEPATVDLDPGSVPRSITVDPEISAERELLMLLSDFEIGERLGAGTTGAVWSAVDRGLDRKVAIKLLRPGRHGTKDGVRMFREARALARLKHPNVVGVHETGRIAHGLPMRNPVYIVMEHVEGATLAVWMSTGPRAWREIVELFLGAGRGLAAAHDTGLIHRDFKPANVLIEYSSGTAKVADFGLVLDEDRDNEPNPEPTGDDDDDMALGRLTRRGGFIGTPAYMAPEQLRGDQATTASDQFAFCLCLWEALHHALPWDFDSIATLIEAAKHDRLLPGASAPSLPRWLDRALRRGLAVNPDERFGDMHELLAELEDGPGRRRRWGVAASLSTALLTVAGLTAWWTSAEARMQAEAARRSSCDAALERTHQIWNDARQTQLREAFSAVGGPIAAAQADRVGGLLRGRLRVWTQERQVLCEAAATRTLTSTEQLVGTCLDERSAALEATLNVLLEPTRETVEDAVPIFYANVVFGPCEGSNSLRTIPEQPARRREYVELRSELAGLRALRERATNERVEALAARVQSFHHDALTAAFGVLEADRSDNRGDYDAVEAALVPSFEAAVRAGDEGLTLEVIGALVRLLALQHRFVEADWLVRYADVLDERVAAGDPFRAARWRHQKATLAFFRDDFAQAAALFGEAAEIYAGMPEGEVLSLGPLVNLATASRWLGRVARAREIYLHILDIHLALYGPDSSQLMVDYTGLAMLDLRRDTAQARRRLEQARATLITDPSTPALALVSANLAQLALTEGAYTEVFEHVEQVRELQAAVAGRGETSWVMAELAAVDSLVALERLDEAEVTLLDLKRAIAATYPDASPHADAVALTTAKLALARGQLDEAHAALSERRDLQPPNSPPSLDASVHLAVATRALARGQHDEAARAATAGIALGEGATVNVSVAIPDLQLLLAELLWRRAAHEQAIALAGTARDALRAAELTEGRTLLLARVEAWIADHAD